MTRGMWWVAVPLFLAACSDDPNEPGFPPETPASLSSITLDGAIALTWSDNAFQADPDLFQNYRVYSTLYDLDADVCDDRWQLEGTTVSPEFIVSALPNGVPRCFTVTAESIDRVESDRSEIRTDTPRPDARNVVVFAQQVSPPESGFSFPLDVNGPTDLNGEDLEVVVDAASPVADFVVDRDLGGGLFLVPVSVGTTVALYGAVPVGDLTSIDVAPLSGFDATPIEALPGWGYVFQMDGGDGFARYGAVRVTHVGQDFLILDWAYQTDPGNPQLVRWGG